MIMKNRCEPYIVYIVRRYCFECVSYFQVGWSVRFCMVSPSPSFVCVSASTVAVASLATAASAVDTTIVERCVNYKFSSHIDLICHNFY
mmetsp:Transcript_60323/g.68374  ORF Transcript_60323/g.68374 Transcript_60323/m.68374 type:complete len:89 (+) Transcript_60323:1-267(+)